jgi:hypothetical protein
LFNLLTLLEDFLCKRSFWHLSNKIE